MPMRSAGEQRRPHRQPPGIAPPQQLSKRRSSRLLVGGIVVLHHATTCQVVWTWTEIPISARRGVIVHRQRLLDWLPLRVTHICAMVYSCTSLYIEEVSQRVRPLLQHAPYLPRSTA
jgi:hypothetical protein